MRINLLFVVLLSFCFTYQSALAQGENMNWHYGRNLSLNFGQTPLTLGTSQVNVMEGCSSVSDASGNLLFYTTGFKIWDKNGVEMPNATGLQGNGPILPPQPDPYGSGYKSVYIIKHPGNSQRYFVVSGDPYEETIKKLYYHVVDMSLNSGLGDVVPGQKNIEIMTDVSENLSVIGGADCSTYWLVAPKNGYSDQYYTFKIDAAGFHNTPVISTLPMPIYGMKELFQTKDRSTVVGVTNTHLFTMAFDGVNGTLSNLDTISTSLSAGAHYNSSPGISKDKAKFYFGNGLLSNLYQVDLDLLPNLTAVKNSMTEVIPAPGVSANLFYLRTAPVGDKIYVIHHLYINNGLTPYLSSLDNASQPAAQVVYTQSALPFAPPGNPYAIYYSLGTDVVVNPPSDSLFNIASDTAICEQDTLRLSSTNPNATQFEWSTGATTAAITVTQSGTYWVKSSNACDIVFDTFRVNFLIPEVTLPADTTLCTGKSLVIEPVANNADRYLWNTGATSPTLTVTSPGTYTVEITTGQGCKASDTINIKEISSYVTILQKDTLICNSMPIVIKAISNLESTFSWNNGTTGSLLTPTESGKYVVTAVNRCGSFTDDVSVEVIDCNCSVQIPDAFTPNGDGINDVLAPAVAEGCNMQTFNFRVYNRFGQLVFTGIRPGQGWDGYFKNRPAETGTYMYYLEYKDRYSGSSVQLKGDLTLMR